MTGIGAAAVRSGFRLHAGGAFPTSRTLEAQSSAKVTSVEASAHEFQVEKAAERVVMVGGSASLLVQPNQEISTSDFASAVEAYRETGDVTSAS